MKTYVGYIWVDGRPGVRLLVTARSPDEAIAAVKAEYGEGHVVSLWNHEDASKQRESSDAATRGRTSDPGSRPPSGKGEFLSMPGSSGPE